MSQEQHSQPIADSLTIYAQLLNEFSTKIAKVIPKTATTLKQRLEAEAESVKAAANKQSFHNANAVIRLLQECLDLRVLRATELSLSFLEKLLVNGLIGYNAQTAGNSPKKGIDEVLEVIIECIGLKEDTVHILVVRCLHSLVLSHANSTVFGENLEYVVSALINIYSCKTFAHTTWAVIPSQFVLRIYLETTRSATVANLTQSALKNIVRRVFDRMERFTEVTLEHREVMFMKRCVASNGLGDFLFEDTQTNSDSSSTLLNQQQSSSTSQTQQSQHLLSVSNNNPSSKGSSPMPSSQSLFAQKSSQQQRLSVTSIAAESFSEPQPTQSSSTVPEQQSQHNFFDQSNLLLQGLIQEERAFNFDANDITNRITGYCARTLDQIVDFTIIYEEKRKEAEKNGNGSSEAEIPLQCVPPKGLEGLQEYQRFLATKLINEKDEISGKYGWCFVCRKAADFYCKQERIAVCSAACKGVLGDYIKDISFMQENLSYSVSKDQYVKDGLMVFKILCKLAARDSAKQTIEILHLCTDVIYDDSLNASANPQSLKLKLISLEMLREIMDNTKTVFLNYFSAVVKDELVHVVLLNAVSQDVNVSKQSFLLLRGIMVDFREVLKSEVQMFIDEILLKILESTNASAWHRNHVITLFGQLMKTPRVMLELFVNYDCHVHAGNICGNVVELLARIAQGKYTRSEYVAVVSSVQEAELRELALQALVNLIKYFAPFSILSTNEDVINHSGAEIGTKIDFAHQPSQESMNSIQDEKSPTNSAAGGTGGGQSVDSFTSPPTKRDLSGTSVGSSKEQQDDGLQVSEARKKKRLIQRCCERFNIKYKEGLKMIFAEGLIVRPPVEAKAGEEQEQQDELKYQQQFEESVAAMAEFLYLQRNALNREALGSCFADGQKYNQAVFAKFLSMVEMRGANIVDGLRIMFKNIYPPGEAEAMDRIIQQFGQKYIGDNPNVFKNEGVTYTLAFAIMMLQTNLYNQTIKEKEKMTLASFTSLVKGISDGENLAPEIVSEIFNSVKDKALGIHDAVEQQMRIKDAANTDPIFKQQKFKQESSKMLALAKQRIVESNEETVPSTSFKSVVGSTYSREFLECLWSSLFATFSLGLEQYEDQKQILLCLDGLKFSIVVLSRHNLVLPIEAFVLCLTKNTGLLQTKSLFSIKNVFACSCLLDIASSQEGRSSLGSSWKVILEYISLIDQYLQTDFQLKYSSMPQQHIEFERSKEQILKSSFSGSMIDKIFNSTSRFECKSITEFIECLCDASLQEINTEPPRVFFLQRLSEVAEFNMSRPRYEWNLIWTVMSPLFEKVGTHKHLDIQHLGIDLLKQLSLKFLQKTELAHYSFQRVFLRPFVHILEHTEDSSSDTLELLMSCIQNIVGLRFDNLKSGWTTVIEITGKCLVRGINSSNDSLIRIASSVISELFRPERKLENLIEVVPSLCSILSRLVRLSDEEMSLSAISYMSKLIDALVHQARFTEPRWIDVSQTLAELWLPTLLSLGNLYGDPRGSVQRKGIETLFLIVETHGRLFSSEFWASLFAEVFVPYFEYMGRADSKRQQQQQQQSQSSSTSSTTNSVQFMKDSCQISFDSLVEVFILNFENAQTSLPAMLHILAHSIELFSPVLSIIAVEQTQNLLIGIGSKLTSEQVTLVLVFFNQVFESSLPLELIEAANTSNELLRLTYQDVQDKEELDNNHLLIPIEINYERILTQTFTLLVLVNTIKQYFTKFTSQFTDQQLTDLQEILLNSYSFAAHFNSLIVYRYTLLRNGFMSESKFPNLLMLQRDSQSVLLLIWVEQYNRARGNTDAAKADALKKFIDNALSVMTKIVSYSRMGESISTSAQVEELQQQHKKGGGEEESKRSGKDVITFIKAQHVFERHKFILHLRSLLAQIILPALVDIPIEEYSDRIEEVMNTLIDLSSLGFARNLLSVVCGSCSKCEACKQEATDSFDNNLQIIMKRSISYISQFLPKSSQSKKQHHKQHNEKGKDGQCDSSFEVMSE